MSIKTLLMTGKLKILNQFGLTQCLLSEVFNLSLTASIISGFEPFITDQLTYDPVWSEYMTSLRH